MASAETSKYPENVPAVELSHVAFSWGGKSAFSISIEGFSVSTGESIMLLGPSGGGKSTLLNLLCGVVAPARGAISILGHDLALLKETQRDRFRAEHFGVVFQMFNLLPYATAIDNVLLPLNFAPARRARAISDGNGSARQAALDLLSQLKLESGQIEHTLASTLSVGQQQRVAAARALIGRPDIIVADEPTSALDGKNQNIFLDMLFRNVAQTASTLVFVTHDESLASQFDRVVRLDEIATVEQGA